MSEFKVGDKVIITKSSSNGLRHYLQVGTVVMVMEVRSQTSYKLKELNREFPLEQNVDIGAFRSHTPLDELL